MSAMHKSGRFGAAIRATSIGGIVVALAGTFLVVGGGIAAAAGNNWYVNPTGSDSNACTTAALPCKTITHALSLASDGDTINLASGTYTGAITITKAVTITGQGAAVSIINANETAESAAAVLVELPTADTNTLTVSGVTIENGYSKFGGGIELITGTMVVNNSTITNNQAGGVAGSTGGGGIGLVGKELGTTQNLTLNNDQVTGNKTVASGSLILDGGGIWSAAPVTLNNTVVSNNSTAGSAYGGGIFLEKLVATDTPTLVATDSQVNNNTSVVGGGIANFSGSSVAFTGDGVNPSTISNNSSTDGAGIYNASSVTLAGTTVAGNTASFEGGGFYESQIASTDAPFINANNDTFSNNKGATAGGAGLLLTGSNFTMNSGSIIDGSSAVGAGLYVSTGGTVTLTNAAVNSNVALDGGGIAVAGGGSVSLSGDVLASNVANAGSTANVGLGGGIFDAGKLSVTNGTIFDGNVAVADTSAGSVVSGWGGAIFAGPSAAGNAPTVTMSNSTINGTNPTNQQDAAVGGGIAIAGNVLGTVGAGFSATPAVFNGSGDTFTDDTALEGGGAYVGGTATFVGETFSSDTASGTTDALGGGLLVGKVAASDPATVTLTSSSFQKDTAAFGGGVAVNSSSTLNVSGGVYASDAATNSGGGLYMGGTATVGNATFDGDTAAAAGGAIYDGSIIAADTPSLNGNDLTIDGNASTFVAGGVGVAANATFVLTQSQVNSNSAVFGGGLFDAPGGTTTVDGSIIDNNTANGSDGGGVFNEGATTISATTLSGNTAVPSSSAPSSTGFGGAIYSGATAASVTTTLTLTADTLNGNSANAASALITASSGSGDVNDTSITNSTVTGNTTSPSFGVIDAFDPTSIVSSTINGNTSPAGGSGGLFVEATNAISVAGSIVSGNSVSDCSSKVVDGGYNLSNTGDTSCGFTAAKNDVSGNPQLAGLANNGGPTQTELPASNSAAINRIPVNTTTSITNAVTGSPVVLCATGSTDQRGSSRPAGPSCDIGSVEVSVSAPTLTGPSAATYLVGVAGAAQTFTSGGTPTPSLTESGTLPSGVTFTDNGDGTATLAGTPGAGTTGTYPITVTASNGSLPNASLSFTLTVDQAPSLTGPASATYTVGTAGSSSFSATGTPTPTISESGALPTGVTFSAGPGGTATISGTPGPGTAGTYPIVLTATNGEGSDATLSFTLNVLPPVTITTTALPGGTVGVAYPSTPLMAINGQTPYTWSIASGSLPAGLSLAPNGTISGKPTGPSGTTAFTVEVTDSASPPGTATQALSIAIAKGTTNLAVNPVLLTGGILTFGNVSATLTGGSPAAGIPGQTVTFMAGSTPICSGVTSSTGAVTCTITVFSEVALILEFGVTATYAGSASWLPSSGKAPLV